MDDIPERQLLIRGGAFATFSTIEKALAGRMLCRPALVGGIDFRGSQPVVCNQPLRWLL